MTLTEAIFLVHGAVSTVYGFGEKNCGDVGHAVACQKGATTATGDSFDPAKPTAAVAAPAELVFEHIYIGLKVKGGKCRKILVNDKMNERWIGVRGLDLTPAAVRLLTGKPATSNWSDRVYLCDYSKRN